MIPYRRQDLKLRRQGLENDLEAHLVISGGRAAMGNRRRAEVPGRVGQAARLNPAFGAHTQRIHLPPAYVAHDQVLEHLVEEIAPGFHEDVVHGAECRCLFGKGLSLG